MTNDSERLQILEMIEKGVITAEEGVRLINSLQDDEAVEHAQPGMKGIPAAAGTPASSTGPEVVEEEPIHEPQPAIHPDFDSGIKRWRRFWWIPLAIGIGITVISGGLMFLAYEKSGAGFWFACLWFPLLFGVLVISLAAASRTARWLHVRVHQEKGEWPKTIAISLPLPIRFTAWLVRIFKPYIDGKQIGNLDEAILALNKTSSDQPLYVKVDEGGSGEKVEVYIG